MKDFTETITNIADYSGVMAKIRPDDKAIVCPVGRSHQGKAKYHHLTFKELNEQSDQVARGLIHFGLKKGDKVVLMATPGLDFFALTFGLFKAGAVPVLIDPGLGLKNLKTCIDEVAPQAFIGISKAHIARLLFSWGNKSLKKIITVGPRLFWGGTTLDQIKELGKKSIVLPQVTLDDMAAILFTSGSTGIPKGVVYKHQNFLAQVELLRETYKIQGGEIDLPTFPLFALFDPALGMTAIIPDMNPTKPAKVNSLNIITPILDFGVTNMFGSPALLNTVGRYCDQHPVKLPSLKRIISAGAPVPAITLERMARTLEAGADLFTPYGATECLPICSISGQEILGDTKAQTDLGQGVCVGRPVANMEIAIIGIHNDPIPTWNENLRLAPGEIGEIVVKARQVTESYYNREKSTRLAKILDESDQSVHHRMGDLGYFDQQGRLWFCGRKAHLVTIEGRRFFPVPCESIFNTHPAVFRSALVAVSIRGKKTPVICLELEKDQQKASRPKILNEVKSLAKKFPHTNEIEHFLFHPSFPVDIRHNSKIFSEKLTVWAQKEFS